MSDPAGSSLRQRRVGEMMNKDLEKIKLLTPEKDVKSLSDFDFQGFKEKLYTKINYKEGSEDEKKYLAEWNAQVEANYDGPKSPYWWDAQAKLQTKKLKDLRDKSNDADSFYQEMKEALPIIQALIIEKQQEIDSSVEPKRNFGQKMFSYVTGKDTKYDRDFENYRNKLKPKYDQLYELKSTALDIKELLPLYAPTSGGKGKRKTRRTRKIYKV